MVTGTLYIGCPTKMCRHSILCSRRRGPNRGQSPVEWGDFPSVCPPVHPSAHLSLRPFPPLRDQEPARQAFDPASRASEAARQASEPASQASELASQASELASQVSEPATQPALIASRSARPQSRPAIWLTLYVHCVRSSSQTVFELRAEYRSLVS